MKKFAMGLVLLAVLSLGGAVAASASNDNPGPPEHVVFCHVAGLASDPANYITLDLPVTAVYGQAGHFNEDGTTQAGHEQDYLGECNPPEPFDQCPNLEGNQPEGTDCNPVEPPCTDCEPTPNDNPPPPPPPSCVFVGADKDGGSDQFGGTNDECEQGPRPVAPSTPAVQTNTPVASTPPVVIVTKPKPVAKPKPKPVVKKKPVRITPVLPKPDKPTIHKCNPWKNGTKRVWSEGACHTVRPAQPSHLTG